MLSLQSANALFQSQQYDQAMKQYESLLESYPDVFKKSIQAKIEMCKKNLSQDDLIATEFHQIFESKSEGWVAVITLWKRTAYLEEQLKAIMAQTIPPNSIIIIQNENHMQIDKKLFDLYPIQHIQSGVNSLYMRWIVGYLANAKYVCVFDDDVISGNRWIENCIRVCESQNALVGPSGRVARPNESPAWSSVDINVKGDQKFSCVDKDVECDWVCNAYFFKVEWIKYIVSAARYNATQKTFDDIQLATTLKHYAGVKVFVPKQPKDDKSLNGHAKREYGHDEHALWKRAKSEHMEQRNQLIKRIDLSGHKWVS